MSCRLSDVDGVMRMMEQITEKMMEKVAVPLDDSIIDHGFQIMVIVVGFVSIRDLFLYWGGIKIECWHGNFCYLLKIV